MLGDADSLEADLGSASWPHLVLAITPNDYGIYPT